MTAAGSVVGARAIGAHSGETLVLAALQHGPRWNERLSGLKRLGAELTRRTSIVVESDVVGVTLDAAELFTLPLLYWGGAGAVSSFGSAGIDALRRYLSAGGMLWIDANDGSSGQGFDASVRSTLSEVLPTVPLAPVARQHVLHKTFYLLDALPGRVLLRPTVEGVSVGARLAVIYTQNDVMGALNRVGGSYEFDCAPGGETQRELAIRHAVNTVMYAMCLDYKDDAVHVPLIMKRRR